MLTWLISVSKMSHRKTVVSNAIKDTYASVFASHWLKPFACGLRGYKIQPLDNAHSMPISQHKSCDHDNDVTMSAMAYQITSLTIVYSSVNSGEDQIKHQSSTSLAFVREIYRGPVNSTHKWPVTRKMFPFYDVIMVCIQRNDKSWVYPTVFHTNILHVDGLEQDRSIFIANALAILQSCTKPLMQ